MKKMSEKKYVDQIVTFLVSSFKNHFHDRAQKCPDCKGESYLLCEKAFESVLKMVAMRVIRDLKEWPDEDAEIMAPSPIQPKDL